MVVRFCMKLERTVGGEKLEIELDNLDVIEALKAGSSSSSASAMFDDYFFMSLQFNHVLFQQCFRESNCVAHELAKLVRFSSPCTWLESPSDHILKYIVNDVTLVEKEKREFHTVKKSNFGRSFDRVS